jgi:hypothetical protein
MPVAGHLYENGPRVRPFLLSEASGQQSRENVTVTVSGATAIKSGTLLGKITATGKYIPYSNAAVDGSQTAVAILYGATSAVNGDEKAVVITNNAEVNRAELTGLDAPAEVELAAIGIKVRGRTGLLGIATPAL